MNELKTCEINCALGDTRRRWPGLEITCHVDTVRCGLTCYGTRDQVGESSFLDAQAFRLRRASNDQLTCLRNRTDWIDIGIPRALDINEGEHEGEKESKHADNEVHLEAELADDDGADDGEYDTAAPHTKWNFFRWKSRIGKSTITFWASIFNVDPFATTLPVQVVVADRASNLLDGAPEDGCVGAEFSERPEVWSDPCN
jgi:hypothetical protein